jgi:hypothetical protein
MKTLFLLITFLTNTLLLMAQNTSSLRFDGVDDHVYIGTDTVFNIRDSITLEAWVKCDSLQTNNFARIIDKLDYANKRGFNIRLDYGSVLFQCMVSDGSGNNLRSTKKIQDNKWHHIAGTYDGRIMRLNIDGKQEKFGDVVGTFSINANSQQPLAIAKSYDSATSNPFKGYIDEVRIWNIARDTAQIRKGKDSCLSGNEKGLVGYWQLDENKDTIAYDKSKNKNNGILKNGANWSTNVGFKELCITAAVDNNFDRIKWAVYPNPITENSIIDLSNFKGMVTIKILNSQGALIKEYKSAGSYLNLSNNDFCSGLYFIAISNAQGFETFVKFMVP